MWSLWIQIAHAGVVVTLPGSAAEVEIAESASEANLLAETALRDGRYDAAARAYRALADAGGGGPIRVLEAASWYEAGQLRLAERAAQAAIRAGQGGEAEMVLSLALLDQGRGDEARAHLAQAEVAGSKQGDRRLQARVALALAILAMDQGEWSEAQTRLGAAAAHAEAAGDVTLQRVIAENQRTVASAQDGTGNAGDPEGAVAARLRAGDAAGARALVVRPAETDRRGMVRALLADAMIDRVVGDLDAAHTKLRTGLGFAREGGMARETAAILGELGTLHALAGRHEESLSLFQEAVGVVAGTSLRLRELALRAEAGRVAVRLGDFQQARDQLAVAERLSARVNDPLARARMDEVRGLLADAAADPEASTKFFESAIRTYEARQYRLDAARVATDLAGLWAGRDDAKSLSWGSKAEASFRAAGIATGPAHVRVARGLGYVKRQKLDEALASFLEAARLAEATGDSRGKRIAAEARNNAALALKALGHTDKLADEMAQATDLKQTMARREAFAAAEATYDLALADFHRGSYDTARAGFHRALEAFDALEEPALAGVARRGRGWAARNQASRLPPALAFPLLEQAASDAKDVGDTELRARSRVQAALLAGDLGRNDELTRLAEAAEMADGAGLRLEAARCYAVLADRGDDLDLRASAARRSLDLAGDQSEEGAYAMYSVAIDAYNAGAYVLAESLAIEAAPRAGSLAEAVESVRSAAIAARAAP